METKTPSVTDRPGFIRRHRTLLMILGGVAATVFITVVILAGVVLYKASRIYPRPVPDIVPENAALYVESLNLPSAWPDVEAFLNHVRSGRTWQRLDQTNACWRKMNLNKAIDNALFGMNEAREQLGLDPLEAFAGSETALAVFIEKADIAASPVPAAKDEGGPGVEVSFIAYTRLATWPVRIAALFPGTAAKHANAPGLNYIDNDRYATLEIGPEDGSPQQYHFRILDDLLILSDNADRLEATLDLAESEFPTGLSSLPAWTKAQASDPPPPNALFRFFGDLDRLESVLHLRKHAHLKIAVFPYNILANYLNEFQDGVVDLKAAKNLTGYVETAGPGTLRLGGSLIYDRSTVNTVLAQAHAMPAGPAFGLNIAPFSALTVFRTQRSLPRLWADLKAKGTPEDQKLYAKITEAYGDHINRILPLIGRDLAVVAQAHPSANDPQGPPPMPWIGLMGTSSDPQLVATLLREVFQTYLAKLAGKLNPAPYLYADRLGEAELFSMEGFPPGVTDEIGRDFSPGFLIWRDRVIFFTAKPFAYSLLSALRGETPSLATSGPVAMSAQHAPKTSNVTWALNVSALAQAAVMPRYRAGLAEMALPLNWDKINADIVAKHGNLADDAFERQQDLRLNVLNQKRIKLQSRIAQNAQMMGLVQAIRFDGNFERDGSGRPSSLRGNLVIVFDGPN